MESPAKRTVGRPPKSGDEPLSERLELRVTLAEKSAYDDAATAAGMERSDWIRMVLKKAVNKSTQKKAGNS
jgi:uncharacterized protein (DUF1778 family)